MIIESELLRDFEEVCIGVGALCTQVVYLIAALVLEFKEGLDVLHMIPVHALEALRRETHGYNALCDVA